MTSASSEATLQVHALREQIAKLLASQASMPAPLKQSLQAMDKELAGLLAGGQGDQKEGGLDDVAGKAGALYLQVGQADATPTLAQQQAADHTEEELAGSFRYWEAVKATSIPDIDRQLREAHLPELSLQKKPETMPEGGDED
jgi:hypothetical protein